MRDLFPEYADLSTEGYAAAWKEALFSFDSSLLLNLYRYQSATRDELLNILGQLSDRIWIPHHVALEFQRNRLKVVAEQTRRFSELRGAIEKVRRSLDSEVEKLQLLKRHSTINPEPLTDGFRQLVETFFAGLTTLEAEQQNLTDPDPLKDKIETLFEGRVGAAPTDQEVIDEYYKQAETRYKLRIPPGYEDRDKDKGEPDEHRHRGVVYKRRFGDFLVWQQLLSHAKNSAVKTLIFVTDDRKEDWWRKIESNGPKTIGPRIELIEEARLAASVSTFLMYSPEQFLKFAKEFLAAAVSDEALRDVREVSTSRTQPDRSHREFLATISRIEQAVVAWLEPKFDSIEHNRFGFPDLIARRGENRHGFEIKVLRHAFSASHRIRETVYRAYFELKEGKFEELTIVWVALHSEEAERTRQMVDRALQEQMPDKLRMVCGVYEEPESGGKGFIPDVVATVVLPASWRD